MPLEVQLQLLQRLAIPLFYDVLNNSNQSFDILEVFSKVPDQYKIFRIGHFYENKVGLVCSKTTKKQKACKKIHTLGVANPFKIQSQVLQDFSQLLFVQLLDRSKGPSYIQADLVKSLDGGLTFCCRSLAVNIAIVFFSIEIQKRQLPNDSSLARQQTILTRFQSLNLLYLQNLTKASQMTLQKFHFRLSDKLLVLFLQLPSSDVLDPASDFGDESWFVFCNLRVDQSCAAHLTIKSQTILQITNKAYPNISNIPSIALNSRLTHTKHLMHKSKKLNVLLSQTITQVQYFA